MTVDWHEFWTNGARRHGRVRPWLPDTQAYDPHIIKGNFGCGTLTFDPMLGWLNLDQWDGENVVVWSLLDLPLPFDDDYFHYIFMSNILEHIPQRVEKYEGEFWFSLIEELLRVTAPNGIWEIHGPDPRGATDNLQKGGHTRLVGPLTFQHLVVRYETGGARVTAMHERYGLKRMDHTEKRQHAGYKVLIGKLTDWHLRKYLGWRLGNAVARAIGRPSHIRMVYQVVKE